MSLARRCAALALIVGSAVGAGLAAAPAASAQGVDPLLMVTCVTDTVSDPVGAVSVPPEVPLVGCVAV
ncbi:hypothetical protein GTU99_22105 [Streptomyces sp. PRKS01-65]|nr:hypothetical protein [Streptomyces harenosi]NEY34859.1 hypothetical protein [Streptomyces harenosi]